ncbi:unnamed protein product [Rangifer tarandus platyrhynchus]|uniref:Uncharacterized protein n=1 Tax=Rangifer tarandus platyrhynchus TaxID=3082113 RepID=A0AC59ZJC4_RANTA
MLKKKHHLGAWHAGDCSFLPGAGRGRSAPRGALPSAPPGHRPRALLTQGRVRAGSPGLRCRHPGPRRLARGADVTAPPPRSGRSSPGVGS